jgi:hypothetical protein
MISTKYLIVAFGLGVLALGCGSDDNSGSPSGAIDAKDCDAVGARLKSLNTAVGCTENSAQLTASCKFLYSSKLCTTQWEALVNCIAVKPATDFQCDADDELELKSGACNSQQAALDTCLE